MEPITLTVAGSFVASLVAQQCVEAALGSAWTRFAGLWRAHLGREPRPEDLAGAEDLIPADLAERLAAIYDGETCLRRARLVHQALQGAGVLWVDDQPSNNRWERATLEALGAKVICAEMTDTALGWLDERSFDVIVSDIARGADLRAGLDDLPELREHAPVIFYVGQTRSEAGVPVGAFGIADEPGPLLHLILDVLERSRI